jgi:hypothetical protein
MISYAIGIDPGVNTGFAVYDRKQRVLARCETGTFWSIYDAVVDTYRPGDAVIIIECAKRIPLYGGRYTEVEARDPTARQKLGRDKIASNIGANIREATLLAERFKSLGYDVRLTPPLKAAKWKSEEFQRITKFTGRTSNHARDAARLCYGL